MKTETKKRVKRYSVLRRRPTPVLLSEGAASITLDNGNYRIVVESTGQALRRDRVSLREDAKRAYARLADEQPA